MIPGTYRAVLKLEGATGGACAGVFWYHDDKSEIDIEVVTPGDSIVNGTINYTSHPSLASDGQPIPNATLSVPFNQRHLRPEDFHEYRFDSHPRRGVEFYFDGGLVHTSSHSVPLQGGNLQFKVWADGDKWWSGTPSTSDVLMTVKTIDAYYNTSSSTSNEGWKKGCVAAGGPSSKTVCTIA
ncbi:hypothetical protein ABEF95_000318 [Exophiala dermatitidis]